MPKKLKKVTQEKLQELYIKRKWKLKDIAKYYERSPSSITRWINKYGLKKKTEDKYIGKKFGKLLVIKSISRDKYSHIIFECKCDCGVRLNVVSHSLLSKNTQSCGCKCKERHWCGNIPVYYWNSIVRSANERNYDINIDINYLNKIFIKQNKKCALTGEIITFGSSKKQRKNAASLDRINPNKGYVKGNVQWVHKKVNFMKYNLTQREFIDFCKKVVQHEEESHKELAL